MDKCFKFHKWYYSIFYISCTFGMKWYTYGKYFTL